MEFLANPDLKNVAALATAATKVLVVDGANNTVKTNTPAQIVAGLDGDKGDITVSASGATWTIDNDVVTYAKMQNVSATSRILGRKTASAGDTEECTLSEVLDFIGSAAQGDILYRGSSGWARLGAGTSGQYLKTQGSAANPVWADVTASGGRSFSILTAQDGGWAISNEAVSNNPGTALMVGDVRRYVVGFKPSNVRVSFYQISTGNNSIGIRVQVSTSSTDWSSAVSSDVVYASYDAGASIMRTGSSTLSLSGSAPYYFRFLFYNDSGSSQSLSLKDLTAEFWN